MKGGSMKDGEGWRGTDEQKKTWVLLAVMNGGCMGHLTWGRQLTRTSISKIDTIFW